MDWTYSDGINCTAYVKITTTKKHTHSIENNEKKNKTDSEKVLRSI